MFWFLKNDHVFYSEFLTNIRGETNFFGLSNSTIFTKFGILFPLTEKASNLFDYFSHGEKALFVPKDEALTGVLVGCNRKVHLIRVESTDSNLDIRVATKHFPDKDSNKEKKILIGQSTSIEESLRPFVFGNYSIQQTIKALDTLSFYAGTKELRSPGWTKGLSLDRLFEIAAEARPLINPDYKE